jgi:hypothetical protein
MAQSSFSLRGRNPDVLTCIANLSNDEVFTPPDFANQMLDTLAEAWAASHGGANIWSDKSVKFLDPCTKTGVFLREITGRLTDGLKDEIPDLSDRVSHILSNQVYGVGITRITSLMARRSVYCSKNAKSRHSIVKFAPTEDGNIWFNRTEHTWDEAKCSNCGAPKSLFDRAPSLDNHAYGFIHSQNTKQWVNQIFGGDMQFDVVIGNPPYQLSDDGFGTSAAPIYQHFVEQAKGLEPRYLLMVIPSRWFAGGKGLDDFRESMLTDNRLRKINDFLSASDVFPSVGLKGGVCYFLWERDNPGLCEVSTHFQNWPTSIATRPLLEKGADVFIRFNEGLSVLQKVASKEGSEDGSVLLHENKRFDQLVSARKPFGLETTFQGARDSKSGDLKVYQNGGIGYVARDQITAGSEYIDHWKVFTGRAAPGTGNKDTYPHRIISTPFIGEPGTVSSETYICIGPLQSKKQAESVQSYLLCKLTRLLILLHKPSQDTTRKVYTFVPKQDWHTIWTDELLYSKYGLSTAEIDFIETVVRPLSAKDLNDE